jgi:HEAT repeat protein
MIAISLVCPAARGESADGAALLARVQSPDAPLHDKATALAELALRGGPESAAALAKLLDDPQLSHDARYALQSNPAPEAGAALRSALDRLHGDVLIGVINSVASRRDDLATPALAKLLQSDDKAVALAAAGALATIGSEATLALLESAPHEKTVAFADPLLQAALVRQRRGELERGSALLKQTIDAQTPAHVKQAATLALLRMAPSDQGSAMLADLLASNEEWRFVAGLQAAVQAEGSRFAKELSAALPAISPDRQARVLAVLTTKGKGASLDSVRAAGGSPRADVRAAAASALGELGDGSDGPLLTGLALGDPEASAAATEALVRIRDGRLDEYLIGMLKGAEAAEQSLAADVLGLRQAHTALPALFELSQSSESAQVRLAALGALRRIAPGSALGQILDLVKDARSPEEERIARDAAGEVALRSVDGESAATAVGERLDAWPPEERGVLLDVLARLGNDESLKLVANAADSPDSETQNQATRVLGAWPAADAAPILLRLASSDHRYSVRSLRGYLRIARQYKAGPERVEMCRQALDLATRDEERLLALQILSLTPSPESLRLAATQLSPAALGPKANEFVIAIAEVVAQASPSDAADAAMNLLEAGGSNEELARAQKLISSQ